LERVLGGRQLDNHPAGVLCYDLALAPGNFVNQGSEKRNCKHKKCHKNRTTCNRDSYLRYGRCCRDGELLGSEAVPLGFNSLGAARGCRGRNPLEVMWSTHTINHFFMSKEDSEFHYGNKIDPRTGQDFLQNKVWCSISNHFVPGADLPSLRDSVVAKIEALDDDEYVPTDDGVEQRPTKSQLLKAFAPSATDTKRIEIQKLKFTDRRDPPPLVVNKCDVLCDFIHFPLHGSACGICVGMYMLLISLWEDIDVSKTLLPFQKKSLDVAFQEQFAEYFLLKQKFEEDLKNDKNKSSSSGKGKKRKK